MNCLVYQMILSLLYEYLLALFPIVESIKENKDTKLSNNPVTKQARIYFTYFTFIK